MDLRCRIDAMAARLSDGSVWQPLLIEARGEGRAELERLIDGGTVGSVHDTIVEQAVDLEKTLRPSLTIPDAESSRLAAERLGTDPIGYGSWAFYPWSRRL